MASGEALVFGRGRIGVGLDVGGEMGTISAFLGSLGSSLTVTGEMGL